MKLTSEQLYALEQGIYATKRCAFEWLRGYNKRRADEWYLYADHLSDIVILLREEGWQDIETAPDNVVVDLWMTCGLKEEFRLQMCLPEADRVANCIKRNGQWFQENDDDPLLPELITHWRKTPSGP